MVLFNVKWYRLLIQCDERIIIDHDNVFTMINTTRYELNKNPYVIRTQCEWVFYSQVQIEKVGHLLLDLVQEKGL